VFYDYLSGGEEETLTPSSHVLMGSRGQVRFHGCNSNRVPSDLVSVLVVTNPARPLAAGKEALQPTDGMVLRYTILGSYRSNHGSMIADSFAPPVELVYGTTHVDLTRKNADSALVNYQTIRSPLGEFAQDHDDVFASRRLAP
jgi:hypothetical protein